MMEISELKSHLTAQGLLTEDQIHQAEDYALTRKISLEDALLFLNLLDFTALGQSLASFYKKSYHPLLTEPPPDLAKSMVPVKSAERWKIFPVSYDSKKNVLALAVENPEDHQTVEQLQTVFSSPLRISLVVASKAEIIRAIEVHYKGKHNETAIELEVPEDFTIVAPEKESREALNLEDERPSEKNILLLDPDLDRSRALMTLLRREGLQNVKWVASPGDVVNSLSEGSFDMILANGRVFKPRGSWLKDITKEVELPHISYYHLMSLLLGQEHPYNQMSEALISLIAFLVRKSLKNDHNQLQEALTRVRYCKLLSLRLGLPPSQVDGVVLAAWLYSGGLGKQLLRHVITPYGLEEILKPEKDAGKNKRIEADIFNLVNTYLLVKKKRPEVASDIDQIRKLLGQKFSSPENKVILEAFLNVIKDEEFLNKVDQVAPRILIVDPEYSRDSSIVLRLSNDGYEVEGMPDASKAVKIILRSGADLVISEINLPGTDGRRFCRALKENSRTAHIPFFFLTSEEGERLAAECLESGADDFLKKPVDLELLSLKIQRILSVKASKEPKKGIAGSLTEMNPTDIIQSLTAGDKDVEISLERKGEEGQIHIQQGEIIHAGIGSLKGEEAFYRLMTWEDGEFEIVPCSEFPSRTIQSSTMSLLMEGARLADEEGDDEGELL